MPVAASVQFGSPPTSDAAQHLAKRSLDPRQSRPKAAVHVHLRLLRCSPSLLTFVHLTALCQLERRSADNAVLE